MYANGLATGILCDPFCKSRNTLGLSCQTHHTSKESVFRVTWNNFHLILKLAIANIPTLHWYDNNNLKYPTEKEFRTTIRSYTRSVLNYSLPSDVIDKLTNIKPKIKHYEGENRQIEMDNIWVLIQDNEYLMTNVFSDLHIFPGIAGTCGPYFAIQYIEPIDEPFSIFFEKDTKENWNKNIKYSIMLLELLEELENSYKEPLHICDVKLRDFGVTHLENGKAKILDSDLVYPKTIVNRYLKQLKDCHTDEDCQFFDCRSRCNRQSGKCLKVTNNNLQIVCEKIFLGWRIPNKILLPGLLMSKYAPDELMVALRQCANPENENIIPRGAAQEEARKQLYSILVEMEQVNVNLI